jgi:hypothetical protein
MQMVGTDLRRRLAEIRCFFRNHTPYYLVTMIATRVAHLLDDPNTTNEKVERLLIALNVPRERLADYRVTDREAYNRQQIKFDTLPLVIFACLQKNLLLNASRLFEEPKTTPLRHWLDDPHHEYSASSPTQWLETFEWLLNIELKVGWTAGGSAVDRTFTRQYQQSTGSGIVGTAGTAFRSTSSAYGGGGGGGGSAFRGYDHEPYGYDHESSYRRAPSPKPKVG